MKTSKRTIDKEWKKEARRIRAKVARVQRNAIKLDRARRRTIQILEIEIKRLKKSLAPLPITPSVTKYLSRHIAKSLRPKTKCHGE